MLLCIGVVLFGGVGKSTEIEYVNSYLFNSFRCIAIQNDYAYVGAESGLLIFDIHDKNNPIQLGNCLFNSSDDIIAVSGNYVYMTGRSYSLAVIDVTRPDYPVLITKYAGFQQVNHMEIRGQTAFIIDQSDTLYAVDLSNSSAPRTVCKYALNYHAYDVALGDSLLYIVSAEPDWDNDYTQYKYKQLEIFDISNPANIVSIAKFEPEEALLDIEVIRHMAYCLDESGLGIFDVSEPQNIKAMGHVDAQDSADDFTKGFAVDGHYAYRESFDTDGITVFDITDAAKPYQVNTIMEEMLAYQWIIQDGLLYAVGNDPCLAIYDISDLDDINTMGSYGSFSSVDQVFVRKGIAYVLLKDYGLAVIDLSLPPADYLLGSYQFDNEDRFKEKDYFQKIIVKDEYAFIVYNNSTPWGEKSEDRLRIVDISDFSNPTLAAELKMPNDISAMFIDGNYAYLGVGYYYLYIIDIHDGANPQIVSKTPMSGDIEDIKIRGNLAYLVNFDSGLQIFDISDKDNPEFMSSYSCSRRKLEIYKDYAFLTSFGDSIYVFDISNPQQIKRLPDFVLPKYPEDRWDPRADKIAIEDNNAYVFNNFEGIYVFDISNPRKPREYAKYAGHEHFENSFVSNGNIYIPSESSLIWLKLEN